MATDDYFDWSDSWLRSSATSFNHSLGIASAVLSTDVYSEANIKLGLECLGFDKDSIETKFDYDWYNVHRVAYAMGTKKLDEDTTLVAVALRGTQESEPLSYATLNATIALSATFVANDLNTYISRNVSTKNVKFWFTGHSRGAGVANLLGAAYSSAYGQSNVFVYGFATPLVVDRITDLRKDDYLNIFNILNASDAVCIVPPGFFRFGSQNNHWFDSYNHINKLAAHSMTTYMEQMRSERPLFIKKQKVKTVSVKCPVDVEVYNSSGKIVGRVVGNTIDEAIIEKDVFVCVDGDEKHFILPADGEYTFKMIGTDNGFMNYSASYTDLDSWDIPEQKEYSGVKLYAGKEMIGEVTDSVTTPNIQLLNVSNDQAILEILEDGTEVPYVGIVSVSPDVKNNNVIVNLSNPEQVEADIIVAVYEGGKLLRMAKETVTQGGNFPITVNILEDADTIKVMIWDGTETMEPLCAAKTKRLSSDDRDESEPTIIINEVLESDHPYENNIDETQVYRYSGDCHSIDIIFSEDTKTEGGYDYIYILDGNDNQIGKYSGTALAGKTITVPGNTVKIRLAGDYSNTSYGYRTTKIVVNLTAPVETGIVISEVLESYHPYVDNFDGTQTYTYPDVCTSIDVTFSTDTETESWCDYIYILDGNNNQIGRYSGTELAGQTINVPGNTFKIRLTSDSSYTYYRYRTTKIVVNI